MGSCNWNYTLIPFHLLLFSLFILNLRASSDQLFSSPLEGFDACKSVDCGQGTCVASNTTIFLGFDCNCNPGWKKVQIGPVILPPCVLPNCTLNFQCGSGAPPPPPPPPPPIISPCAFVWCGDGNCVVNDTTYYCKCFDGATNVAKLTTAACLQQCYFGEDCNGVQLGRQPPPPPPSSSGSPGNGSNDVPNCSRNLHALTILVLWAIFLTWI